MENREKQCLYYDGVAERAARSLKHLHEMQSNDGSKPLEFLEFLQPGNILKIWYVDEIERNKALKEKKPFSELYDADSYFRITKRIDNTFIEGVLGHPRYMMEFFDDFNMSYSYFKDYLLRKKIYFSFDKITLYQVTDILPENPLRFILRRLNDLPIFEPNTAFMIMPFKDLNLNDFFQKNIKIFLEETFNIKVHRADDFLDNDVIIDTIYRQIEQCEFVIADVSAANKNVFYELGYAVSKDREVITIQNKAEPSLFFDRAHVRSIFYSFDEIEHFKTQLKGTIETIRNRT